jgi:hypothetical protein
VQTRQARLSHIQTGTQAIKAITKWEKEIAQDFRQARRQIKAITKWENEIVQDAKMHRATAGNTERLDYTAKQGG